MPDNVTTENDTAAGLPALPPSDPGALLSLQRNLSPSLRIMLDERLYEQVKRLAGIMARDTIFTPRHLVNKPEACFTVITQAVNWNIDPHFVARSTYQTPGGSIGFEGKLIQAILEQTGRFVGGPKLTYIGDWKKVTGKFTKATSQKGNEYIKPTWTEKDADGLGIIISWQVKGEAEPRVWPSEEEPFYLTQCFPLNSPLWASDPKTQIAYLGLRRFGSLSVPGILGGMPFDYDDLLDASERLKDVTPERPTRDQFQGTVSDAVVEETAQPEPEPYEVTDLSGEVHKVADAQDAGNRFVTILDVAERQQGEKGLTAIWESNALLMNQLEERFQGDLSKQLSEIYGQRRQAAAEREAKAEPQAAAQTAPASTAPVEQTSLLDEGRDPLFVPLPRDNPDWPYFIRQVEALIGEHPDGQSRIKIKHANSRALGMLKAADYQGWLKLTAALDGREAG